MWSSDTRVENRNNRTIAVTISPWHRGAPLVAPLQVALTKDISPNGICLICPFEVIESEIVIGFYVRDAGAKEPLFFQGDVVRSFPFAAGFWQVGVRAEQLLNTNFRRQMKEMVPRAMSLLVPPLSEKTGEFNKDDPRNDPFNRLRDKQTR